MRTASLRAGARQALAAFRRADAAVAVSRATAGAMLGFVRVMGPLLRVLNGSANRIVRAVGVERSE